MSKKIFNPGDLVKVIHNSYGDNPDDERNFKTGDVLTIKSMYKHDVIHGEYGYDCVDSNNEYRYLSMRCEARLLTEEELNEKHPPESILVPVKEDDKLSESKKENMGVRLNSGKLRWRNFPMFLMEPVIAVGSYAEKREGNPNGKYETFNFLKGMYVNDCMDSLKRHLLRFESPYESDNDEESTESHLAHIAWNALVALHMLKTRPELDDRYKLPVEHVDDDSISEEERYELAKALQDRGR